MTSLQTLNGGVEGSLLETSYGSVARTMAQHVMPVVEAATAPYQYALST